MPPDPAKRISTEKLLKSALCVNICTPTIFFPSHGVLKSLLSECFCTECAHKPGSVEFSNACLCMCSLCEMHVDRVAEVMYPPVCVFLSNSLKVSWTALVVFWIFFLVASHSRLISALQVSTKSWYQCSGLRMKTKFPAQQFYNRGRHTCHSESIYFHNLLQFAIGKSMREEM